MTFEDGDDRDGLMVCVWCEGEFVPCDMDGEHCHECADKLFNGDGDEE